MLAAPVRPTTAHARFAPGRLDAAGAQEPRKIAVFRALQLGDMLCAVPALRALRHAHPHAEITLIGLPWAREFVRRFSAYLDDFIEFPGHEDFPEQKPRPDAVPFFFDRTRRSCFDLAIQLHGSGPVVNGILENMGARRLAGFYLSDADRPAGRFCPWPERGHEVRRLLRLTEFLGLGTRGEHLEFPTNADDAAALERLPEWRQLRKPFVCIHPGARLRSRRWFPERFARVADALARKGYGITITGAKDELDIVQEVASRMSTTPVITAGRTTLGALAVLLQRAELLVCNDTGISHIAASTHTPSVVIVLGSEIERWAPLDHDLHPFVSSPASCRPCYHDVCPIGHGCATGLAAGAVIRQAEALLERRASCVRSAS